ncbi:ester cyclase [Paenibacillus sp. TAF58]
MKTIELINIETVTAFIKASANQNDLDCTDQFFSSQIGEAFPDKHYSVEEVIAQGEKVIARIFMTGTHIGTFAGHLPTGNSIKATQFREFRIVDGQIVEHRGWFETATLLPQIKAN